MKLSLFIELEHAGFSSEIVENMISAMKSDVKSHKKRVNIGEEYSMMKDGEKKKRCKEIIADIQNEMDQYFQIHISDIMESYLEKEDSWAEALYVHAAMGNALRSEREKIVELKDRIEKMDQSGFDKIKSMQVGYLISNLQRAIEQYEGNGE